MSRIQVLLCVLAVRAWLAAQPTVAPTPQRVGPARGENAGGYNVVHSFETGYRFHSVGGNRDRYRSDVNFGNGIRLLGSNLTVHSRDGHGSLFDEIVLTTQGLGNDPYQSSTLRVQRNSLYRYDLLWRLNDYVNPGLIGTNGLTWSGQHPQNTERRIQDHDLTLMPQSKIRFVLGFTRNRQDGPALATVQLFDGRGDEFPFFQNLQREWNEYRVGGEIEALGVKLHWTRGWNNFKEDTTSGLEAPSPGLNPDDRTTLSRFWRPEPYHGNSPFWRVNLHSEAKRKFTVQGRFTYVGGQRTFLLDETAIGTDRFGAARNRQILVTGFGRRPVTTAAATASFHPTERVTITHHAGFHHTRMEGNSSFREFLNNAPGIRFVDFDFLGVKAVSTLTEAVVRPTRSLGILGGYHFSSRRVRSVQISDVEIPAQRQTPDEQTNRLHAGLVGVRWRPLKPLSISVDAEVGRADRPLYPTSERDYHALGARVQYKSKSLQITAGTRTNYNFNSFSLATHSARSRVYSVDGVWTASARFSLEGGYSQSHIDTLSALAYFANLQLVEGDVSYFESNLHAIHAGARIPLRSRVDLYLGYSRVHDTGDGRATPERAPSASASRVTLPGFVRAQTFPLAFDSPQARVSLRIRDNLRWNAGYQWYGYGERFAALQNYRAHTGFTSLLWSF